MLVDRDLKTPVCPNEATAIYTYRPVFVFMCANRAQLCLCLLERCVMMMCDGVDV
jgi:hypothetical protein